MYPKSMSLIVLLMILAPTQSSALDSRAIGAWSQSAADCATTFKRSGREIRFREPRDELRSAFIIGNGEITTTAGRCKILKESQKSDTSTFKMSCNNAIGFYERAVQLTIQNENTLTYGFPDNSTLDVVFTKCRL